MRMQPNHHCNIFLLLNCIFAILEIDVNFYITTIDLSLTLMQTQKKKKHHLNKP